MDGVDGNGHGMKRSQRLVGKKRGYISVDRRAGAGTGSKKEIGKPGCAAQIHCVEGAAVLRDQRKLRRAAKNGQLDAAAVQQQTERRKDEKCAGRGTKFHQISPRLVRWPG